MEIIFAIKFIGNDFYYKNVLEMIFVIKFIGNDFYYSSVPIWDVAMKTSWKQWTIGRGGKRGSGISVLMV